MTQTIKHGSGYCLGRRGLIIAGALSLQMIALTLVLLTQQTPTEKRHWELTDHIVTTLLAGIFCLVGLVIFLRIRALLMASMAYGVFVCASLIFCFLNINTYRESVIAMSLLAVIAHGLATAFVCQFALPTGWSIGKWRISSYALLILGLALCIASFPVLILFSFYWLTIVLLIYAFPSACMVIIIWNIFSGLHQASMSNRSLDGMPLISIVFVLLSFSIISGKSTPYHIIYLPSTSNFFIFYASLIACVSLCIGMMLWIWQRMISRLLQIVVPLICIGALLLLGLGSLRFFRIDLAFLHNALKNFFAYHLLSILQFFLPIFACYAFIYRQLANSMGLLSRRFIRGMLWLLLASCFVVSEIISSVLAVQNWDAHGGITLACLCWLFLTCWLFPLFWGNIRNIGDRMFYRDFYHYNHTLRDLSLALTRLRDLNQICAFLLPRLTKLLNASGATLLVYQEMGEPLQRWQQYLYEASIGDKEAERFKISAQHAIAHFLRCNDEPQLVNGILVLPLSDGSSLRGCLCLGEKLNCEPYSRQDKSFLETLAAQLAVLEANTRYLDQVYAHAQQITALNHRIVQVQEEERRHLALELHDDVLQQAMMLTRQLTDLGKDNPDIAKTLPLARSITSGLRTTCLQLRPPLLDELGLPEALRWLAQQAKQQSNMLVRFQFHTMTAPFQRPPYAVELALYRVAQEALTNTIKHAEASLIHIRLRVISGEAITLLIADNGRGLQHARPLTSNLGLAGMTERMQAIGGQLHLRSSRGHGVVICAQYRPPATMNAKKKAEAGL